MATEVLMPRQGQSVESCIIVAWKVKEGDKVAKGQGLCEVETDKATFEVESPADGAVIKILYPADSDVPVLKTIAYIGAPGEVVAGGEANPRRGRGLARRGESASAKPAAASARAAASPAAGTRAPSPAAGMPPLPGGPGSSPRARALAEQRGVSVATLAGTGPDGRVIERDVAAATAAPVSPAAAAYGEGHRQDDPCGGVGPGRAGDAGRFDVRHRRKRRQECRRPQESNRRRGRRRSQGRRPQGRRKSP
jgi:pyruvate dehydrogenase E2 component (dihydrolipoamide acetyltransferase)